MTDVAIRVENLGKLYQIGEREPYKALRDVLTDKMYAPLRALKQLSKFEFGNSKSAIRNSNSDSIWALKDVSFEIKHGEVVGIIGRNGAGKSTLLKILSRITEPTEGYAAIHGRVGSLLEVGTGFHPELTGRENIYLNGAILGMRKAEIECKFDEIVAFAEIEKFIDTPVKRYSSGMYVRLAFAVAAHLEPEILLVDEVLAVGDAAFQRKCLGKMDDVAKEGRTVLFVSHNMQAVQSLCRNAFHFETGRILVFGGSRSVVARYLAGLSGVSCEASWLEESAPGNEEVKLTAIRVFGADGESSGVFPSSEDIYVEVKFIANTLHSSLCVGFDLITSQGEVVTRSYQTDLPPEEWPQLQLGQNVWHCTIPKGLLNAAVCYLCPRIGMHNACWIVNLPGVVKFEVVLDHGVSPFWNVLDGRNRPGIIAPILRWESRHSK